MAKRGYRGKHPNNDMKVAPTSHKAANLNKLTKEYNKTGAKNKYDYIKSHDGFYPQGTGTITIGGTVANTKVITIVSTNGTSKAYVAAANELLTSDPAAFDRDAGTTAIALSIIDCVNADHIPAVAATAADAIDVDGVAAEGSGDTNTVFTMRGFLNGKINQQACTITLDADQTTASVGHDANAISIGIDSLADAAIQALVTKAINGTAHANIKFATSGVCQSGINDITAVQGSSDTQIDIAVDTAGAHGNGAVLANGSGEELIDDTTTGGGVDIIVPGHKGQILATSGGAGIVNLTQIEPGPDGNATITSDAVIGQVALTGFTGG